VLFKVGFNSINFKAKNFFVIPFSSKIEFICFEILKESPISIINYS
jgi:hypothetical protein